MPWQPKSTAPAVVVLDSGAISLLLAAWPALQYLAPSLAGEVIQTASFCAAGPMEPPVGLGDIVWFGFAPDDGRPHTLLTVTRAIARAEAFAKYCEEPSQAIASWHLIEDGCWLLEASGQDMVIMTASQLPNSATKVRLNYQTGWAAGLHTAVTGGGRHVEQTGIDTMVAPETGKLTGPDTPLGTTVEHDFTTWRAANPTFPIWPAIYVGGGHNASPEPLCGIFEWWGTTGSGNYTPPEGDEDPGVDLPDGTGATLDQLEVKLDQIQEQLRQAGTVNFALDPSTANGADELVVGDLGDAVGVHIHISNRPATRDEWIGEPSRFPKMAQLTVGNIEGWWAPREIEHDDSVVLPLPRGATRYTVQCEPPMQATVTLYRPIAGP